MSETNTITMEPEIKTRKPRTKKEVTPHVAEAKKAISAALKAEQQWRMIRDKRAAQLERAEAKLKSLAQDTVIAWKSLAIAAQRAAEISELR